MHEVNQTEGAALVSGATNAPAYPFIGDDDTSRDGPHPLSYVHGLLWGRYRLMIVLAIVGASIGAGLGYYFCKSQYTSIGLIRVRPSVPRILYATEQNTSMPLFDSFVESQVSLLHSQRLIDMAIDSSVWKAVQSAPVVDSDEQFSKRLTVTHDHNSEMVSVEFSDTTAENARAGVKATVDAYMKLDRESDADSTNQRLQILDERRTALANELKGLNDRVYTIASAYGSVTLDSLHQSHQERLNRLEAELQEARLALATTPDDEKLAQASTQPATQDASASTAGAASLPPAFLTDPEARHMLARKAAIASDLDWARSQYGNHHPTVAKLQNDLAAMEAQITQYASILRNALIQNPRAADGPNGHVLTHAEAEKRVKNLESLREQVKVETLKVGQTNLDLGKLKREADGVRAKLDETTNRIEQLNVEARKSGLISVVSDGNLPLHPAKNRRLLVAVGGGIAGAVFCMGMLTFAGVMDRRLRYTGDPRNSLCKTTPVLGVLPSVPGTRCLPEQAVIISHCVHRIRALLQSGRPENSATIAITSGMAGAGKTTFSIAMGLSFAATGSRVLLIDGDIIGGGVTHRLKKFRHRRLAQLLIRQGVAKKADCLAAVTVAQQTNRMTGEVLVEQGIITNGQLEKALEDQKKTSLGLREALAGEPLKNCVVPIGKSGLFVLPLGSALVQHVGQLSHSAVNTLLACARENFDYVLIDTGPFLGSLEAAIVCEEVDDVIFAVARGDDGVIVEKSLESLKKKKANVAGLVFNRARPSNVEFSIVHTSQPFNSRSSVTSRSRITDLVVPMSSETVEEMNEFIDLGPIASAVAMQTDFPTARRRY